MRAFAPFLVIAGLVAAARPGLAQDIAPEPTPIEAWSLSRVTALGDAIYRQDVAAAVATDALLETVDRSALNEVRGWIVTPDRERLRVRFLRQSGADFVAGWDIVVRNGRAGRVEVVTDGTLSDEEKAQFTARQTAAANIGALRCSAKYNTVVLRDPDSDDWLVWLLVSVQENDVVPVGGHYRFRISGDGKSVIRRDQLSASCLAMRLIGPDGQRSIGLTVNQIVSDGPVETHVFLSRLFRIPIFVSAGGELYQIGEEQP